jgi:D-inositol-3-phosphate glycosyltransferase
MKKNLIIGPAYPLRGGIADFNEALCKAFNQNNISSSVISFYYQYPSFLFPGTSQVSEGNRPQDMKIESLISSVNPFSWFRVAKKIRKENPDFVIIRYWLPFMAPALGTIAKRLKKNSGIKVIAIVDNVIPHERRIGDRMLTNYFVKQCDAFVAMSKSVLEDLKSFTVNPHTLFTPHPIYNIFGEKISKEEARKNLAIPKEGRYILFFGFIRAYKGLDLLLEAIADERIRKMNIKLIVAGEFYENASRYHEIISKNNLADSVILKTSFIPKEDVKNYFCASDLVVQPYRDATQSGITQIAYQFERPMLVTNVGGLSEIVPDQKVGYVVEKSPKSIADAIVDYYERGREEEFSKNAGLEKNKFSWENFVQGVLKLYREISGS